jgi:uncharacterized protein YigA (DUF484 family)
MNVAWPARSAEWDQAVARFLRANPDWLADHPELYRALTPPARVHGEAMADHMAAMVLRERRHAETMAEQTEAVLAVGRLTATTLARVHEAVLALIGCDDVAECLAIEIPRVMGVDAAALCLRTAAAPAAAEVVRLERLLGAQDVLFRCAPERAAALYCEAAGLARVDVLIRVPGWGVLALASRDRLESEVRHTGLGLQFLGRAVAGVLDRRGAAVAAAAG